MNTTNTEKKHYAKRDPEAQGDHYINHVSAMTGERLRASYDAALDEIASLQARVQELGKAARDVNSRRVQELEAQLEAIGAGGVEPLRKRCLHQISEPAKAGWCDGCSPDNCGGCGAAKAAPVDAERLDYLQECGVTVEVLPGRPGWTFRTGGLHGTVHRSVRTAIDAARAAQEGK